MIASIMAVALSGCGSPAQNNSATAAGDDETAKGQRIATEYLKDHGGALDACFLPPPAIRGPGAIQTVADDARPKLAAINRLVIAIDASGSMAARSGGETKMEAAKRAAITFLASVPANTEIGLVAFGHRGTNLPGGKAASCRGVESLYPLGAANPAQVETALRQVRATGWTPLAAAITLAGKSFTPSATPGAQVVYVVSDGLETCGGDPVAAARALNQGAVKAIVNIIGFDLTAADRAQLSAVASAGGGTFVEAKSGDDVGRAMDEVRRKARNVSAMTTEYFDAGARSTDNNFAVGKYTTDLNFCVARTTSAEMTGLRGATDAAKASIPESIAAMAVLQHRHETYRERSSKLSADLSAKAKAANDAIAAQQGSSEKRLGVKP
ncbi:vWA domain-containing protein [Sphingomonas sp. GB1N7]|uniref:vWA domain-containing protein n=1 Tax=Parasphingomonas caseinilytica TaxID=3096158 RepID=UPI002FC69468